MNGAHHRHRVGRRFGEFGFDLVVVDDRHRRRLGNSDLDVANVQFAQKRLGLFPRQQLLAHQPIDEIPCAAGGLFAFDRLRRLIDPGAVGAKARHRQARSALIEVGRHGPSPCQARLEGIFAQEEYMPAYLTEGQGARRGRGHRCADSDRRDRSWRTC